MQFNFDNVQAAAEKIMTPPGTIGVFKMSKIEFGTSKQKGTAYMKVTFDDKESSFNHSFYLVPKALSRVQALAEAVGKSLSGNMSDELLTKTFLDKELALKVTGQVSDNGKGYPNLSFGGFCKPKNEVQFLSFNRVEQEEIEIAKAALSRNASSTADQEPYHEEESDSTASPDEKW